MQNAGLDESQGGINISGRNINNLRYGDDTTLMAESEEELKSLSINVKEESEKLACFNVFSTLKKKKTTKIIASCTITSGQINGEKMEA